MRFVKRFGNGCKEKNDDVSEFVPPAKALKRERDLPILFGCEFCQCFYLQALLMKICMEQRYLFASCFNSLDWFYLQRPWKRKEFAHFVWLWKLALFWVLSCRLCMAVLNFFMEQKYFFASHLHSLDWFHLQRLWKQRKRFIHFVWLWKLAVFLFASFAWWIWTFLWNRGTFLLHAWILQIGSLFTIENDNNNGHFCGTWSLAKSKANVLYKKMQKSMNAYSRQNEKVSSYKTAKACNTLHTAVSVNKRIHD